MDPQPEHCPEAACCGVHEGHPWRTPLGQASDEEKAHSPCGFSITLASEVRAIERLKNVLQMQTKNLVWVTLEVCFWACPNCLHPVGSSAPSTLETTRTVAHLAPHLQDAPPKQSPNALETEGKMVVRKENWGDNWGVFPSSSLSSRKH